MCRAFYGFFSLALFGRSPQYQEQGSATSVAILIFVNQMASSFDWLDIFLFFFDSQDRPHRGVQWSSSFVATVHFHFIVNFRLPGYNDKGGSFC